MSAYKNKRNLRRLAAALQVSVFAAAMGVMPVAYAAAPNLPTGGYSTDPSVSITTPTAKMTRITSTKANNVIQWSDFSVGKDYQVIFNGKNYLNYVTGGNQSFIYGSINNGGGRVYLLNPNGITIGSTASFTGSGSFIASTKNVTTDILNYFRTNGTVVDGAYSGNKIVNNLATSLSNADITLEDKDITIKYINSADDFTAVEGGLREYAVYLTKDITYTAPISNLFNGTFDGNNHTITLKINKPTKDVVGLFEQIVDSSTVQNLKLTGSVIGHDNVGALVGVLSPYGSNVTIKSVFNEANVTGHDNVGALIGSVNGYGSVSSGTVIIDEFKNTGKITSTASPTEVGEVIGIADEYGSSLLQITISNGEVTKERLVGKEFNNQVVTNKPDKTYDGYGPGNYIKVEKVEIVQPPQPEPEPQPEPQPEPDIPDIRSIQDAINAARPSGTSDTDDIEKSNLLGDSHAGFMMNNTNAVREVSVDEEQLAAILGENGEAQPSAEGIGFSTRLTGETQTTTEQVEGMFTGDNVAEVDS